MDTTTNTTADRVRYQTPDGQILNLKANRAARRIRRDGGTILGPVTEDTTETPNLAVDAGPPEGLQAYTRLPAPPEGATHKVATYLLDELGLAVAPPSMATNQSNRKGLLASRRAWENSPEAVEGLRQTWAAVNAERRTDVEVPLARIRMNDDGTIDWGDGAVPIEGAGLQGLVSRAAGLFPRAAAYMAAIPAELRAHNWNSRMNTDKAEERNIVLRTRQGQGGAPQIYAVVSTGYTVFDADDVARVLGTALKAMPEAARGETTYNSATTNMRCDATFHAEDTLDAASGDVFKFGIRFRSNDAAKGGIRGEYIAWRPTCMNFSIVHHATAQGFSIAHKGGLEGMVAEVQTMVAKLDDVRRGFAGDWTACRESKWADLLTDYSGIEQVMRALAESKRLALPGGTRDAVVERLLNSWAEEPGDSVADVLNAITRCHGDRRLTAAQLEEYEIASGRLMPILAQAARGNDRPLKAMALPVPAEA